MKNRFKSLVLEVVMLLVVIIVGVKIDARAATTVPYIFPGGDDSRWGKVNDDFSTLGKAIDNFKLTPGPQGPQGPVGPPGPAGPSDTANQVRDKFFTGTTCAGNSANDVMVKVGPLCVDKYEESIWQNPDGTGTQFGYADSPFNLTDYPAGFPQNGNWTTPVYAVSMAGVIPSTNVTWFQAQQACALSGKRLLTNAEWQMAAAGTPDPGIDNGSTDCAVLSGPSPVKTGSRSNCVSNWMVNDMVGGVWEWVADWMQGSAKAWAPSDGNAGTSYGNDLMGGVNPAMFQGAGSTNFPSAVFRGGGRFSATNAGVFSLNAYNAPSYLSNDIGFRCAR
jgi:hypothetical protein